MNNTQSTPATTPDTSERDSEQQPRKQPIPRPSEPKQYRAIGLVRGKYQPGEELTRGNLVTEDGTEIDAVLLGRVISLVKNHLDLEKPYLWVVYPRTRQEDDGMHVQIAGVWEPELLHDESQVTDEDPSVPEQMLQDRYFSVRGEAIYHSLDEEKVIVKIQQMPRKGEERRRFFKLHLDGVFPSERPLGHFWDIHAILDGNTLRIQEAEDVGIIIKKRRGQGKRPGGGRGGYQKKRFSGDRGKPGGEGNARPEGSARPTKPTPRSNPSS